MSVIVETGKHVACETRVQNAEKKIVLQMGSCLTDEANSRVSLAVGSVPAEHVDCSGSGEDFAAVYHPTRNQILLPFLHRNPFSANDEGIATLHNEHVFVVIVNVFHRRSCLSACPDRHLASICPVEHIASCSRSGLLGCCDSVRWMLHELRKVLHSRTSYCIF